MDFYRLGELVTYTSIYSVASYIVKTLIKNKLRQATMDKLNVIYYVGLFWIMGFLGNRDIFNIDNLKKFEWVPSTEIIVFIMYTVGGYYAGKTVVKK